MPRGVRHTIEERVAAATDLGPTKSRVAQFLLESRERAVFLPATKIAAELGVSDATVIRTAQRLGYAGLAELRSELQEELRRRATTGAERTLAELAEYSDSFLRQVMATRAKLLDQAGDSLREEAFDRAADLLGEANRIVVLSLHPYPAIADHFVQVLQYFGRKALLIGRRVGQDVEELLDLESGDVLVLPVFGQTVPICAVALNHARTLRVPSILITDTQALALKGHYTVALNVPRREGEMFPTATVPLAVFEALTLAVASRDRTRTRKALRRAENLRSKLQ